MDVFTPYLDGIANESQRNRVRELLTWISESFAELEPVIKWNQPMFTHHGTFILGVSTASKHISITPEERGMTEFSSRIDEAGFSQTKGLFRVTFAQDVPYDLLADMIEFNIADKAETQTFWRV